MKKFLILFLILITFNFSFNVYATYDVVTYVKTPNGTDVLVLTNREPMDDDTVSSIYEMNLVDYPNAIYLAPATNDYNCHSYAWYLQDHIWNLYWMPDPSSYITDGSYYEVTSPMKGDIIVYYDINDYILHSGVVDSLNETTSNNICGNSNIVNVKSKWGTYGLYLHRGDQCPYTIYNSDSDEIAVYVKYYRTHAHNYVCRYKDGISHVFTCICGDTYTSNHKVNYSDAYDGDNIARCLECKTSLDLSKDMATIVRSNHYNQSYFYTDSGILILVDISLDEYYLMNE